MPSHVCNLGSKTNKSLGSVGDEAERGDAGEQLAAGDSSNDEDDEDDDEDDNTDERGGGSSYSETGFDDEAGTAIRSSAKLCPRDREMCVRAWRARATGRACAREAPRPQRAWSTTITHAGQSDGETTRGGEIALRTAAASRTRHERKAAGRVLERKP